MPVLDNPKHEAMAQGLAKGLSQIEAYTAAGYKPNDGHAARLAGNGRVKARVVELVQKTAEKAINYAAIDVREQMAKMLKIVDLAIDEKDLKVAADAQKFILKCFGYEDSPTLTHEHMAGKPLETKDAEAVKQDQDTNVLRFASVLKEIKKRAG